MSVKSTQIKISFLSLFFLSFIFVSCSDSKNDPKAVAENFYNSINDANYDDASKYANSETQDRIAQLKELKTIKEEVPYEFVEAIGIKDEYSSGDTVIVKYKVGKRKEEMNLVYDSEVFKVVNGRIGRIRKLKLTSFELYNLQIAGNKYERDDKEIELKLEKNFGDVRFEVSDLLLYKYDNGDANAYAIAYDKKNNYSPISKCWYEKYSDGSVNYCHDLLLNGVNLSLNKTIIEAEDFDLLFAQSFYFAFEDNSELLDVNILNDVTKTRDIPMEYSYPKTVAESFSFKRTFNVEGIFGWVDTDKEEYHRFTRRNGRTGGSTTYYAEPVRISFYNCRLIK